MADVAAGGAATPPLPAPKTEAELKSAHDGDVEALLGQPLDDVGEDGEMPPGDRFILPNDEDKLSMGLKHCASGLKLLPAAA